MIASRIRNVSCLLLVLCLAGCRRPAADAAELTAGDPGAGATPREDWQRVADLPDCPAERCTGLRMGMPNWTCPDGRTGGPVCKQALDGTCAWTVVRCPQAGAQPTPTATVAVTPTRTPLPIPTATPTATKPHATGTLMSSAADAVADACAKTCAAGKTRRGIVRCVGDDRAILGVAGAINCPALSTARPEERPKLACAGFVAETECANRGQCLKMDGTCCDDDGSYLVLPTGQLGNMYCGSPGQRCSRCRCLPGDARIATPDGDRPLRELTRGERVWTQAADGRRVAAPIVELVSVPAPPGHRMLELVLEDGRVVRGSPTHPSADGTPLETFTAGTLLDGSRVKESRLLPAPVTATHDILPAGETGIYWANGVRLHSTIPPASDVWTSEAPAFLE